MAARIAGVILPSGKHAEIALTYIYGIGQVLSEQICKKTGIPLTLRVKDLTEDQVVKIRDEIRLLKTEGDLRREISMNIKRLQEINCYRGTRHKKALPCRGQRTKTNARTKRGRRQTVANKKKETK